MKALLETTKWVGKRQPNHTYLMTDDKSKIAAYIANGTTAVFKFKAPIRIDIRGRTFKEIPNVFGIIDTLSVPTWQVTGSKGEIYTVSKEENGMTCSCSGFRFRSKCKHAEQIEKLPPNS